MLSPAHFGDVNQSFYTFFKFDKRPIFHDGNNFALDLFANGIFFFNVIPMVFLKLLQTKAYATLLFVIIQHFDGYLLVQRHDIRRMRDPSPREIGNMQQPIDSAQINEDSKVSDILDHAFNNLSFLQLRKDFLADFFQAFLDEDLV